jgi:hypothetical protein
MQVKKTVKDILEFLEPLFDSITSLYEKLFGSEYKNRELLEEWQTISFDNSINAKIRSAQTGSLEKHSLILYSNENQPILEKLNDLFTIRGYKTEFVKDPSTEEFKDSTENTEEFKDSTELVNNIASKDGFLFIYSPIDLELDLLKTYFKDKCRVFIFSSEKLDLRYRLSKSGNEVLENPDSNIEADIVVFSLKNLKESYYLIESFIEIFEGTRGTVPIKILYRLVKEYLEQHSEEVPDVEYSIKGSCNRLALDYITNL